MSKRSPIETILQVVDFSGGQLLICVFLRYSIDYYLQKCGPLINTVRAKCLELVMSLNVRCICLLSALFPTLHRLSQAPAH